MGWKIDLLPSAIKDLKKLDKHVQTQIVKYLQELRGMPEPLSAAKKLTNSTFYRFRCGDYRLVCKQEGDLLLLIVLISHRKSVYGELNRRQ